MFQIHQIFLCLSFQKVCPVFLLFLLWKDVVISIMKLASIGIFVVLVIIIICVAGIVMISKMERS